MSYAVTGTLVVTWKAPNVPVPAGIVALPVAVACGQEATSLVSTKFTPGAPERYTMATSSTGMPCAASGGHCAGGVWLGTYPNFVESYVVPERVTVSAAGKGHVFAIEMAKHGCCWLTASRSVMIGVLSQKSQPRLPWLPAAAAHAAMHLPPAQPWSLGHVCTTFPFWS